MRRSSLHTDHWLLCFTNNPIASWALTTTHHGHPRVSHCNNSTTSSSSTYTTHQRLQRHRPRPAHFSRQTKRKPLRNPLSPFPPSNRYQHLALPNPIRQRRLQSSPTNLLLPPPTSPQSEHPPTIRIRRTEQTPLQAQQESRRAGSKSCECAGVSGEAAAQAIWISMACCAW